MSTGDTFVLSWESDPDNPTTVTPVPGFSPVLTEAEFLSLARKVWEDVPDGSLGVTMVRRSHAILRWASELDLPDAEHTDFWRDLDRALREQEPELTARIEAEMAPD